MDLIMTDQAKKFIAQWELEHITVLVRSDRVIAAIVFIALGTLIVHLIMSWWSAPAALH